MEWLLFCHAGGVDEAALRQLVEDVQSGALAPDDAVRQLRRVPFVDLGVAKVDHHRHLRHGAPEAIYGPGKSPETLVAVVTELLDGGTGPVIATRVDQGQVNAVLRAAPNGVVHGSTIVWRPASLRPERIVVVSAGSSDQPVVDECAATLGAYGFEPEMIIDVGVAGIHRLLAHVDQLGEADAVIAVAGMEGALASVVSGLAMGPVVAVPTSVGYGAGLEGVTALLSMLASCASGLTVVGIDNGFGAASAIARMFQRSSKGTE